MTTQPLSARRQLGRSELRVSPLCLGGNVFGWTAGEKESFEVLDAFLEAGGNFVDTADVYSHWAPGNVGGESETILGRWVKARGARDRVIVATKVGSKMPTGEGLSERHIRRAVDDSLRRLQVERIDLLYAHKDDPRTPVEETVRAFDALVRAGKVRVVGASNFSAERLGASLELARREGLVRYEALQPNYNLVERVDFEGPLEALCRRERISVAPYYGLAAGFLTGKYRQGEPRPASPRAASVLQRYGTARGWAVLEAVRAVASRRGASPAQVALAWLLAQPTVVAPIASATSAVQLRELLGFERLVLSPEDLAELDVG
ncbi:aldo/keto reductase [Anaeromyxobacter oryzisoli]|uniref:aldo/keto reductase n=1 Tax=Anaeromyxobacter oryzisoli TaxID=2925408 RepID=UPI001F560E24|nr:aldo/keto reductase [Anaeromyxobacter sp. SG63]